MRLERPIKALRRESVASGETDEANRVPGAAGNTRSGRRRPGRAAALRRNAASNRSQRWRNPEKGGRNMRRGNLAKGSRTAKSRR